MGFPWANLPGGNALHAWDFLNNTARWNSASVGALSNTPGWTFTRASTGYAQNAAGVLLPFASGELRRTDKGVLIEGARTNLCLQSQTFDNASWTKTFSTITADMAVAPDGTTTADKHIGTTDNSTHQVMQSMTTTAAAHTWSIYAKAAERSHVMLYHGQTAAGTVFDLSAGTIAGNADVAVPTAAIIQALGNGWYRCSIVVTATAASNSFRAYPMTNSTTYSYAGDGTSGLYLWGAQLEAASFPSSYIPTTTASATRAADVLSVPVSGIDYPISLFAEFELVVNTGANMWLLQVDDGSANNRAALRVNSTSIGSSITVSGGAQQSGETVAGSLSVGTTYKEALRITTNDIMLARGGTLSTGDASATNPAAPTTIRFGADNAAANQCFGYLRRAALWTRALTDAELQAVTT